MGYIDPDGRIRTDYSVPPSNLAAVLSYAHPREASPTGKSCVGIATGSILAVDLRPLTRTYVMDDVDPIYQGDAGLTVQGVVDPYLTYLGYSPRPDGLAGGGPQWRP